MTRMEGATGVLASKFEEATGMLAPRVLLDRALTGFLVASVVVFAGLGVNEVTGSEWGMVRTLGQYQSVLIAVLMSSTLAQEFERGTIDWGLTQSVGRLRWLAWRMSVPTLAVMLGSLGLGLVMTIVHRATPEPWLNSLSAGELSSLEWQWPVGASMLALGIGTLTAMTTRRVVPAVSIAGPLMVIVNVAVDATRGRVMNPGDSATLGAWGGLGVQLVIAVLVTLIAGQVLRKVDL